MLLSWLKWVAVNIAIVAAFFTINHAYPDHGWQLAAAAITWLVLAFTAVPPADIFWGRPLIDHVLHRPPLSKRALHAFAYLRAHRLEISDAAGLTHKKTRSVQEKHTDPSTGKVTYSKKEVDAHVHMKIGKAVPDIRGVRIRITPPLHGGFSVQDVVNEKATFERFLRTKVEITPDPADPFRAASLLVLTAADPLGRSEQWDVEVNR